MGRDYSKGACMMCKSRKKKCDELKPRCRTCVRLQLPCSYDPGQPVRRAVKHLGVIDVAAHIAATSAPPASLCRSLNPFSPLTATQDAVLRRAPDAMMDYMAPTCDLTNLDLGTLWHLSLADDLVRNAMVATFSVVIGSMEEHGALDRVSYGNTLRLLRSRIPADATSDRQLTRSEIFKIQVGVQFMGFLNTSAPELNDDALQHWMAVASFIISTPPLVTSSISPSDRGAYILLFEGMAYHSCLAVFSKNVIPAYVLWKRARVFAFLRELALEDLESEQVSRSPLIFGQYTVFEMVFEVTLLHRLSAHGEMVLTRVIDLENLLEDLRSTSPQAIKAYFSQRDKPEDQETAILVVSRLFLNALSICLKALRKPSQQLGQEIDHLMAESMKAIVDMPKCTMCHMPTAWPLTILACTARNNESLRSLESSSSEIRALLDPGHGRRFEATVEMVRKTFAEVHPAGDGFLPRALLLLGKTDGILA